jgi:glycosyltransferase involved in cell wall biosynthesis
VQLLNFARNFTWKQMYLPVKARLEKADLLVCMDPIGPLASPVPVALILYDLIFLSGKAQTDAWTRYWRFMVPRCARKADLIFTLSQTTRSRIVEVLGVPPERVVVFRTGVAAHFRTRGLAGSEERMTRRELGLPDSYMLTVGAHDPRRNVKVLLGAYQRLKAMGNLCQKLVVVGPRPPSSGKSGMRRSREDLSRTFSTSILCPTRDIPCTTIWRISTCIRPLKKASGSPLSRPWRAAALWSPPGFPPCRRWSGMRPSR